MDGRPLTAEEAKAVVERTRDAIKQYGMWAKVCNRCGNCVGGRVASFGEPTAEDLRRCACPECGAYEKNGGTFRAEFLPPREGE